MTNLHPDAATITAADAASICTLDAAQYTTEQCVQAPSFNNDMAVLVQRHVGDQIYRVVVMFKKATAPVHYESSYIATEPAVGAWSAVHAEVADHNGDTFAEAWIGYRYAGTGGYLDLDILDPRATGSFFLGGLRELPKGRVDVRTGGADVISAADVDATSFLVQAIGYSGLQWRVNTGTLFPLATAPPIVSDFP